MRALLVALFSLVALAAPPTQIPTTRDGAPGAELR